MDNSIIDVIVVNYNRPYETRLTINSLLKANDNIRIILINTYSKKVCLDDLPLDKIIELNLYENLGFAKAVNFGIKLTKSKYIMYCHNDIVINDSNWIRKAVNFLKENKEAGLVDVYGWKKKNDRIYTVSSLRPYITRPKDKHIIPEKDFEEVSRADSMANIFKKDNIRADERYGMTCTGVWIEILAKGLKLYVIKIKDGVHLPSHHKFDEIEDLKLREKQRKYQKSLNKKIRLLKLKEHGLEFAEIFE